MDLATARALERANAAFEAKGGANFVNLGPMLSEVIGL